MSLFRILNGAGYQSNQKQKVFRYQTCVKSYRFYYSFHDGLLSIVKKILPIQGRLSLYFSENYSKNYAAHRGNVHAIRRMSSSVINRGSVQLLEDKEKERHTINNRK